MNFKSILKLNTECIHHTSMQNLNRSKSRLIWTTNKYLYLKMSRTKKKSVIGSILYTKKAVPRNSNAILFYHANLFFSTTFGLFAKNYINRLLPSFLWRKSIDVNRSMFNKGRKCNIYFKSNYIIVLAFRGEKKQYQYT